MKTNARKSNQKFLVSTFGLLLLLAACPHIGVAQTNTFPNSGNVGVGTTSPASILTVQTTGTDSGGDKYLRIKSTNSFSGLLLDPGQAGDAPWLVLGGYPNAGDFTVREYGVANYFTIKKSTGNVGIGTSSPVGKLEVTGSIYSSASETNTVFSGAVGNNNAAFVGPQGYWAFRSDTSHRFNLDVYNSGSPFAAFTVNQSGNVGIGTTSPNTNLVGTYSYPASVKVAQIDSTQARLVVRGSTDSGIDLIGTSASVKWMQLYNSAGVTKFRSVDDSANLKADNVVAMDNSTGNVGIGTPPTSYRLDVYGNTNVTGNINVTGSINAKYQDVAEWVPASHALPAGTVVTLDPTKANHVEASTHAYDTRVAGVVSERPGITLGEQGDSKVLVATTGRVKVMVDASHAPIHIGDLLVTSDRPGVAMKSEPITISGRQIHSPGTLIGKALEPLEQGSGKILVLLSLQ